MIYALADPHGCYDQYIGMIERINLSEGDTLYVLGDAVDHGPDGIKILLDIARRENVVFLKGNHDDTAYRLLSTLSSLEEYDEDVLTGSIHAWMLDGGGPTLKQYLSVSGVDRCKALGVIENADLFKVLEVNGQRFFLAHTVPEKELMADPESCSENDYLWGEPDYQLQYFDDAIIVTGHTPTGLIDKEYTGRIYSKKNHIALDCGAAFGNQLGCICLDTLEEFYV